MSLLGASVVTIAALGALIIWHLVRRGRLIREGLKPPQRPRWPEIPTDLDPEAKSDPDPDLE